MNRPERTIAEQLSVLLGQLPPGERDPIRDVFETRYLANPLPRQFVDGMLLFLVQATGHRFPLYLLGAMLLEGGSGLDTVRFWLDLDGWQESGPLMIAWRERSGRPIAFPALSDHTSEECLLLGRSIAAAT